MEYWITYKSTNDKFYKILISDRYHETFLFSKSFFAYDGDKLVMTYILRIHMLLIRDWEVNIQDKILTRMGLELIFQELNKDKFEAKVDKLTKHEQDLGISKDNWFLRYPKKCLYRRKSGSNFFCSAGGGDILEYECEKCLIPDDLERCNHLIPTKKVAGGTVLPTWKPYEYKCRLDKLDYSKGEIDLKKCNPSLCSGYEDLIFKYKSKAEIDKRTKTLQGIIKTIFRALRKSMGDAIPKDENEIRDKLEVILTAGGYEFVEEDPQYLFSTKRYRPDLTSDKLEIAIEAKLINSKEDVNKTVKEMNEDINPYKKKYKNIIFVVYDTGFIIDQQQFKLDFEAIEGIHVIIIKH